MFFKDFLTKASKKAVALIFTRMEVGGMQNGSKTSFMDLHFSIRKIWVLHLSNGGNMVSKSQTKLSPSRRLGRRRKTKSNQSKYNFYLISDLFTRVFFHEDKAFKIGKHSSTLWLFFDFALSLNFFVAEEVTLIFRLGWKIDWRKHNFFFGLKVRGKT